MQNSAPQHKSASGRFRRYALRSITALCVLGATAIVAVWGTAEWRLHQQWPVVVVPLRIQPSPTLAAVGERNFHIFGCYGCHKEAGNVLFEAPYVGRLVAPNITRRAKAYSDEALLRLIRYGVKQDGTTAIAMPARVLGRIADQDVAAIISYVRSLPERPDSVSSPGQWGPLG